MNIELSNEFPTQRVADHEVFMSFNRDDDAIAWREWWADRGEKMFLRWVKLKEKDAKRHAL